MEQGNLRIMNPRYMYIKTNKNNTALYFGVTSNLAEHILELKLKKYKNNSAARYNSEKVVYW